ncbi:hypothetical protein EDD21DRAFT_410903 [Dissophora ornata]|nr:hypothetical protein EDD21DRAFT_410903 [Dissophora ornata]
MARINPLSYPEILFAVGEHIPVFHHSTEGTAMSYTPGTMLTCCLVSKFWRQTFLPFLWREYDSQLMLRRVPLAVMRQYSDYVRLFHGRNKGHPLLFTQLSEMKLESNFDPTFALKLLAASTKLKKLMLDCGRLIDAMSREVRRIQTELELEIEHANPMMNESDGQDVGESRQIPDVIFEPLANLGETLQELHLGNMVMAGSDLLRLLSPVAKKNLKKISLWHLSGTFDLKDLVFVNVVWLDFKFNHRQPVGIEEIIGHCPSLEHLTLYGYSYADILDRIVHILQGTQSVETEREREKREKEGKKRRQWPRPQLSTLRLGMELSALPQNLFPINHHRFMALIKACSKLDSGIRSGYQGSLRELAFPLSILQDDVWEAIKYQSSSLEVLCIQIKQDELDDTTPFDQKQQIRVLCRVLKSCRRLRVFEFQNFCKSVDVSCLMEDLMGRPSKSQGGHSDLEQGVEEDIGMWECLSLESLILKGGKGCQERSLEEKERLYLIDDGNGESQEWVMPTQWWDPRSKDGTDALLDTRWSSSQLFQEDLEEVEEEATGDELIKKFLRHIAPSKKLKSLQLGQLNFFSRQPRRSA